MSKQRRLLFVKAEGAGNDFVIIDNRTGLLKHEWRGFYRWLCDRHYGVGADGVILVERSERADVKYVHLNSDGSQAGMCGNGSRCLVRYAHLELGLPRAIRFEIGGRVYRGEATEDGAAVYFPYVPEVQPVPVAPESSDEQALGLVDVGVPHFVVRVDSVGSLDVVDRAAKYRWHPAFPGGTNVDFVQIFGEGEVLARTYERGVEGETLACGTGGIACAAAVVKAGLARAPVRVRFPGGTVTVSFVSGETVLSGPANLVFRGELWLSKEPEEFGD